MVKDEEVGSSPVSVTVNVAELAFAAVGATDRVAFVTTVDCFAGVVTAFVVRPIALAAFSRIAFSLRPSFAILASSSRLAVACSVRLSLAALAAVVAVFVVARRISVAMPRVGVVAMID